MLLSVSQEPFCTEIYRKKAVAQNRCRLCASLRSRNAHRDVTRAYYTRATWDRNLQEKCSAPEWAPWLAPAFTTTVRTPQWGHTVWGKTMFPTQDPFYGWTLEHIEIGATLSITTIHEINGFILTQRVDFINAPTIGTLPIQKVTYIHCLVNSFSRSTRLFPLSFPITT